MLVLSRRENESIVIGDDITITVVEIRQSEVVLAIEKSGEVPKRLEVCKQREFVVVDKGIEITLVSIRSEKVRLGIVLPPEVPVHRGEVYESIYKEEPKTMYERFTDRARKVMQLANQEAQRFNHEYIGTEHILLGLVKEGSGVAANVLKNLDVDLRKIRLEVEKVIGSSPDIVSMGKLPQTPRAKKVIEYAMEEARSLNHNYVGTEHILLGLLREQEGVAAQVLTNLGLKLEEMREEVLNLLGHGGASSSEEEESAGLGRRTFRLSVESRGVLQHAMEQAEALNHGNLSTGHLLLGFTLLTEGPVFECFEKFVTV